MAKIKSVNKFGKKITYCVDGVKGSWLMVKDGGLKWLHLTSKDLNTPKPNTPPIFVNRKGMWNLLVHFGCDREDLVNVYKKDYVS